MLVHQTKAALPTEFGIFEVHIFIDSHNHDEIMVLTQLKKVLGKPLIRIHSSCATGDIFFSRKCDCGQQLKLAMEQISKEGGLFIYLPQEGRGIGLANKIKAYAKQDALNLDTVDANLELGFPIDARKYDQAYLILKHFDLNDVILLSNNPRKVEALLEAGVQVERRPLIAECTPENKAYLNTKAQKMEHFL
ncbi:MAG: GTP cyclohydrolase II [Gammaproteobacteria bacterium]|nr:GTP cyclohydrolase II [Gammaproteobacteria bacterium]